MATEGLYIRIRNTSLSPTSILLTDVHIGEGGRIGAGYPAGGGRPGPVYVPVTGYVDLYYSSTVALSYEEGCIRRFLNGGYITTEFRVGLDVYNAMTAWEGWGNYNDSGVAQPVLAGVWTQITDDGGGPQTEESFMPEGVAHFWDTSTNLVDLTGTRVGDTMHIRVDFLVTPSLNNSTIELRLWFLSFGGWGLSRRLARLDEGAGIPYHIVEVFTLYIGSNDVRLGGAQVDVKCGSAASVVMNGVLVIQGT